MDPNAVAAPTGARAPLKNAIYHTVADVKKALLDVEREPSLAALRELMRQTDAAPRRLAAVLGLPILPPVQIGAEVEAAAGGRLWVVGYRERHGTATCVHVFGEGYIQVALGAFEEVDGRWALVQKAPRAQITAGEFNSLYTNRQVPILPILCPHT